jgi:hypothetical protein
MGAHGLASFAVVTALGLLLASCDQSGRVIDSEAAPCGVGKRPGYFVPRPPDSPVAVLGCARLGVHGKRVEFSGTLARIDGELHSCVDPAYNGRGRRGVFIPSICKFQPPLSRFAVRDVAHPRQGVRGYAFVIWGTAAASTSEVVAHFNEGSVRAAVLPVRAPLARRFGEAPFNLFVVEIPLAAASARVVLRADGPRGTERLVHEGAVSRRAR